MEIGFENDFLPVFECDFFKINLYYYNIIKILLFNLYLLENKSFNIVNFKYLFGHFSVVLSGCDRSRFRPQTNRYIIPLPREFKTRVGSKNIILKFSTDRPSLVMTYVIIECAKRGENRLL